MTRVRVRAGNAATSSLLASLAVAAVFATGGYLAVSERWAERSGQGPGAGVLVAGDLGTILSANLGSALLLYSGAATCGVSTVFGLSAVAIYVGATLKVGVVNGGWAELGSQVGLYAPAEFVGLLIVASGGLYPLTCALRRPQGRDSETRVRSYASALPGSLLLLAVGLMVVVLAAVSESFLIESR